MTAKNIEALAQKLGATVVDTVPEYSAGAFGIAALRPTPVAAITLTTDLLNTLVTSAIWRAEQLDEHGVASASAWAEVSSLEEELAKAISASQPEGRIARRGAVRAALKARDFDRARTLTQRYLAEKDATRTLQAALRQLLKDFSV